MTYNPIQEQLALLQSAVEAITDSTEYRRYLKVMARFPSYSLRNTLLIYAQKPDATFVAGYQSWQTLFGRHVRKGEKGIRILAPCGHRRPQKKSQSHSNSTEDVSAFSSEETAAAEAFLMTSPAQSRPSRIAFRSISVFDISQTEGRPLPEPLHPVDLEGKWSLLQTCHKPLEACTGFRIERTSLPEGLHGRCRYTEKTIQIDQKLEEAQAFKTTIHECAHALLHSFETAEPTAFEITLKARQDIREIEAESVSFLVCCALGLDASQYSFPYIASWKQQNPFLPDSLPRIAAAGEYLLRVLQPEAFTAPQSQPMNPDQLRHLSLPDRKAAFPTEPAVHSM